MMSVLLFKKSVLNLLRMIHDQHCSIGLEETSFTFNSKLSKQITDMIEIIN